MHGVFPCAGSDQRPSEPAAARLNTSRHLFFEETGE